MPKIKGSEEEQEKEDEAIRPCPHFISTMVMPQLFREIRWMQ